MMHTKSLKRGSRLTRALLVAAGLVLAGGFGASVRPAAADAPSPAIRAGVRTLPAAENLPIAVLALKPDLVVAEVNGRNKLGLGSHDQEYGIYDSGIYSVVLRNEGTGVTVSGAELAVDVQITGPLVVKRFVLASHGLQCQVQASAVQCRGGRLQVGDQALVQLELEPRAVGTATITATVDPGQQVSEVNEQNNRDALTVNIVRVTDGSSPVQTLPSKAVVLRECLVCRVGTQP